MKNLLSYAANLMLSYKGYGSIDKGIEVINYRSNRKQYYTQAGMNNYDAYVQACMDTDEKYGIV